MKDRQGQVIGFEKLNFLPPSDHPIRIAFEAVALQEGSLNAGFLAPTTIQKPGF